LLVVVVGIGSGIYEEIIFYYSYMFVYICINYSLLSIFACGCGKEFVVEQFKISLECVRSAH